MFKQIESQIQKFLDWFHIKYNSKKLKTIPNSVILASMVFSLSAIIQFLADIVLESLSVLSLIPKIPFRIDFVSLTIISALLGYQTVVGLRKKELDITHNALQMGIIVESALVIGDIYYIREQFGNIYLQYVRLPFLVLTTINILMILFIVARLKIRSGLK